jgi:hypothetical protein
MANKIEDKDADPTTRNRPIRVVVLVLELAHHEY